MTKFKLDNDSSNFMHYNHCSINRYIFKYNILIGVSSVVVSIIDCGSIDPCSIHGLPIFYFFFQICSQLTKTKKKIFDIHSVYHVKIEEIIDDVKLNNVGFNFRIFFNNFFINIKIKNKLITKSNFFKFNKFNMFKQLPSDIEHMKDVKFLRYLAKKIFSKF